MDIHPSIFFLHNFEWMDEQVDRQVRKAALVAPSGGQSNNF